MVTSVRHPFVLRPKPGRLCSGAATLCGAVKVEEDELLYTAATLLLEDLSTRS